MELSNEEKIHRILRNNQLLKEYENSKYYNPTIDEFHIGFEYQIKDEFVRDWEGEFACKEDFLGHKISCMAGDTYKINFGWTDKVITVDNPIPVEQIKYIEKDDILEIDLPNIRVKYLDDKDIKELGWIRTNDVSQFEYEMEGEFNYKLQTNFNTPDLFDIKIEASYINHRLIKETFDMFLGDCKNKSELKRLMKQLQINGI